MDTLPIKLNFFKRVEQFFELRRLDKLYELQMSEWEEKLSNAKPDEHVQFTFPTWNVERKILYWTYFHHKHLGTHITTGFFDHNASYLSDWKTDFLEVGLTGSKQVLQNLIAHGFADDVTMPQSETSIVINSDGLLAGSILYNNYEFISRAYARDQYSWQLLSPVVHKMIGYYMLYSAAWLVIIYSISFVSFQVISTLGLLSQIKNWLVDLPQGWKVAIDELFLLPPQLLIFGAALILIGKKGYNKK